MLRRTLFSAFSHALHRLFHGAPNRRARRAMRRSRTSTRLALECLESRVLLSSYIIADLGTLSGGGTSDAAAINAKGQVVGESEAADHTYHATLWNPGMPTQDLGKLAGGFGSAATAINDLGAIVGMSDTASAGRQPFLIEPGGSMTDIAKTPPGFQDDPPAALLSADGISGNGVIVGKANFNAGGDGYIMLPYAYDQPSDTINSVNAQYSSFASGEATAVAGTKVVANLVTTDGISQAVVADINAPDKAIALPAIANQTQNYVYALSNPNASGIQFAVGDAIDSSGAHHAVLWTIPTDSHSATVTDLGHVSGGSYPEAHAVNVTGDVVGRDEVGLSEVAFVKYHDGAMTTLDSLLPSDSGIKLVNATGINDAGQICADGFINGQEHAFLLTPIATAPPQATLTSAADIDSSGGTTYSFVVTYSDDIGIDPSTLANAIGVVKVGGGFSQTASLLSTSGKPTQLAATYQITAPGGTWGSSDNGTYNITLNANVVKTTSGQTLGGGVLGPFHVEIDVPFGSISGTVYHDLNANGKRDAGEGPLSNIDVFVDLNRDGTFDSGDRITQTDANGAYSFTGLDPEKDYYVMVLTDDSSLHTTDPSTNISIAHVGDGQNVTGVNFNVWTLPRITDIAGQTILGGHGKTAQFDQPATVLHITGLNFDAGDQFYFGNDQAFATLANLQTDSYGSQTFDLSVPDFATTGPLVIYSPITHQYTTILSPFTVDSYRNVNGYSFNNWGTIDGTYHGTPTPSEYKEPNYTFDELTTVYGSDQTYDHTIFGSFKDPLALLDLAIINSALDPSQGECFGFALSSARLMLKQPPPYGLPWQIENFPTNVAGLKTATTVSQLAYSYNMRELLRDAHLEQSSEEFLAHQAEQTFSNIVDGDTKGMQKLIAGVKGELAQGRPVLICFSGFPGESGGHCVLAYNVEDDPGGGETLDIYDPDLPYNPSQEDDASASKIVPGVEDGTAHESDVLNSKITFDSHGFWQYQGGAGFANGGMQSITWTPLSVMDSHTLITLATLFAFGSATETQVTDSSGHTLLKADGTINTDPKTVIPNATRYASEVGATPLDLIEGTGNFMQTITGTGSGAYGAASLSADALATISGISTAKGQIDQFGLDPTNNKLTFIPGAAKSLNADLTIKGPDGATNEAQVSTSATGGKQTLQFQGGQVEFQAANDSGGDTNPTESISLNFGHVDPAAMTMQTFSTGRLTLAAGDTVDVLPSDWNDLQDATAEVAIHHADGTTTTSTISNSSAGAALKNLKEGVSFNVPVAAFANVSSTGLSASIDWGDGATSTGTVGVTGTTALVGGTHTYAQQGYYTIRTTLSDSNGELGQAASEAVVSDADFSLASANVSAFAGVPFSGKVATLTDTSPGDTANDFDVKINWGDGATSAGTLQETAAGQFDVLGSHTWAAVGNESISVTVTEHGSASGQGQTLSIGSNTNFSGTVAQLQLPIPGSDTSDYTATIDWGDGTTSTGTLTHQSDGSALLTGSHTYATGGKSYITHFTLAGGPSVSTTSTAAVSPAVGTATGTLFGDINGNGKMDSGEEGITGQVVYIDENNNGKLDSGESSAVTNAAGAYTITNAPAGNIHVREIVPSGFRISAPATGSYTVTLDAGQTLSKLDLANTKLALISGTVFVDANSNGKQDASEPGQANQIVYLDLNNDGVLQPTEPTAITDTAGAFAFTVNAGTYVVRLESFSDFTITTPASGAYTVNVNAGSTDNGSLFGEHSQLPVSPPPVSPPPVSPPPPPISPPPSPVPPPTLHTPPLLAFLDSFLHGVETINSNETETVIDSFFGITLFVSTYDGAGNLKEVTLFGINITFLFG